MQRVAAPQQLQAVSAGVWTGTLSRRNCRQVTTGTAVPQCMSAREGWRARACASVLLRWSTTRNLRQPGAGALLHALVRSSASTWGRPTSPSRSSRTVCRGSCLTRTAGSPRHRLSPSTRWVCLAMLHACHYRLCHACLEAEVCTARTAARSRVSPHASKRQTTPSIPFPRSSASSDAATTMLAQKLRSCPTSLQTAPAPAVAQRPVTRRLQAARQPTSCRQRRTLDRRAPHQHQVMGCCGQSPLDCHATSCRCTLRAQRPASIEQNASSLRHCPARHPFDAIL